MFKFIGDIVTAIINALTGLVSSRRQWTWTLKSDPAAPATNNDIDELIRGYMKQHAVKAGQLSLFINGNLTMSSAYTWGESDYPITMPNSVMRVASCSKAFTTAAILDLLDRTDPHTGLPMLRADDKVFDILLLAPTHPFPMVADPMATDITVRHLIEHTGGWNYRTGPNVLNDWVFHLKKIGRDLELHGPTEKEDFALYVLCKIRLDFPPGTRPNELFTLPGKPTKAMDTYSNIGYVLLGMIVDAKASSYIGHLNSSILPSLGISDVTVGNTRRDQTLPNEVLYESAIFGPDATLPPRNLRPARLPYGGDGSRKEVMDSGGGLIMSANSLAKFIGHNNVLLEVLDPNHISELKKRTNQPRQGSMPGTEALAYCFQEKGGSKLYDLAVIFNKQNVSKKDTDNHDDFDRLVQHLEDKIREVF
jgi:CubicO group peptidase (beta-lactamase class C family)